MSGDSVFHGFLSFTLPSAIRRSIILSTRIPIACVLYFIPWLPFVCQRSYSGRPAFPPQSATPASASARSGARMYLYVCVASIERVGALRIRSKGQPTEFIAIG